MLSLSIASLLLAAADPSPAGPPSRVIDLTVYGEDACPTPQSEEEIVVCARRPESERYRIPRRFRDRSDHPLAVAWGARAMELEDAQRDTRPNGCSNVGSCGATGCTQAMIRQWWLERRQAQSERDIGR
jgi:hypothetical protein